jgi:hypothetical protein
MPSPAETVSLRHKNNKIGNVEVIRQQSWLTKLLCGDVFVLLRDAPMLVG